MNGAECLLRTLLAHGVDTCFMNPGTSEMQFVSALDRVPGMRGVLCLFEGVCSGAADGYARMLRRPAATLLHLGPGLGNALTNFHNARKARSPVVSIVGQHTTGHLRCDAPLVGRYRGVRAPGFELRPKPGTGGGYGRGGRGRHPRGVRTAGANGDPDCARRLFLERGRRAGAPARAMAAAPGPAAECVREAARVLRGSEPAGLLLGGGALLEPGIAAAGQLAAGTGVRVFANRFAARMACGGGRFTPQRLAYFPEAAEAMLAGLKHLILVESHAAGFLFRIPGAPRATWRRKIALSTCWRRSRKRHGGAGSTCRRNAAWDA